MFEFGGGKALPVELTGPVRPIPSEERWKASEADRVARLIRRRKGLSGAQEGDEGRRAPVENNGIPSTMFDQVII